MAAGKLLVLLGTLLVCQGLDAKDYACPSPNGVFENPEDCASYYVCEEGKATLRACSKPLHFNPYTTDCDWPLTETCSKGEYSALYPGGQPGPLGPVEALPQGVTCGCKCRVRHPCNCSRFFECRTGRPILHECASGLHFNPITQVCDLPNICNCRPLPHCPTTTRPPPPTTTTCPTCPPCEECIDGEIRKTDDNCACYEVCCNGKFERRCCPHGLNFSDEHKACGFYPCPGKECPCHCCLTEDPCDCTKYYVCLDGVKYHKQCGDGLAFDPVRKTCIWKHEVDHCCTGPIWWTTTTKPPPPTSNPICRRGDGHYKHPNCKKFYHCSNGIAYVKDCPAGLNWSVKYDRCEWPHIAPCV